MSPKTPRRRRVWVNADEAIVGRSKVWRHCSRFQFTITPTGLGELATLILIHLCERCVADLPISVGSGGVILTLRVLFSLEFHSMANKHLIQEIYLHLPLWVFVYRSPPNTRRRSRKKRRKRRRRKRKRNIITITTTAMEVERSRCRMALSKRRSLCQSVLNNHNVKLNQSLFLICKLWVMIPKSESVQQNVHVQRMGLIRFFVALNLLNRIDKKHYW